MTTAKKLTDRIGHIALDPSKSAKSQPTGEFSSSFQTHLNKIFETLSASKPTFLKDIQHEAFGQASNDKGTADPLSSLAAFHAYMASPEASAIEPPKQPDLSAPITDYFISSSHNTYLTGNQLYSDAAPSAYTNVLLSGCRCVEIDIWDGEPESESDDENSSSSSDSSSVEEKTSRAPTIKPRNQKPEKPIDGRSRLGTVSSKIGSIIGRKSAPGDATTKKHVVTKGASLRVEPRVLHGHTLTKGTTFREVCSAIRDSAFVVTDLPVIVSLEVHACLDQQQIVVEIMEEAFKGMLIQVTPEMEANAVPPALGDLKRKILVKVKWVPEKPGNQEEVDDRTDDAVPIVPTGPASKSAQAPAPVVQKPVKILHSLSKYAVFTKGYSFRQFAQPEAKVPGHVFSLSEKAAREADEKFGAALFEHNRKYFMRIYPFGLRVNSSNLDPTFFWRRGAQIVALNWQNADKGMMLNHGMFDGEQGWVLKPQGYRSTEATSTPIIRRKLDLSIEVLAGQDIVLPPGNKSPKGFNPYVACYLHVETLEHTVAGPPTDNSTDSEKSSFKRVTKSAQGVGPDFGGHKIQFPSLSGIVEELTFVRFKVKDDEIGRDSLAAWACIRLDRLQNGYRVIRLYRCDGLKPGGLLLVRITKAIS